MKFSSGLLWTWDDCGDQLDYLLSIGLLKPFFDNVLLELGGLPHVLPLAVHLDLICSKQVEGFNSKSLLVFEFVY